MKVSKFDVPNEIQLIHVKDVKRVSEHNKWNFARCNEYCEKSWENLRKLTNKHNNRNLTNKHNNWNWTINLTNKRKRNWANKHNNWN